MYWLKRELKGPMAASSKLLENKMRIWSGHNHEAMIDKVKVFDYMLNRSNQRKQIYTTSTGGGVNLS